MDLTRRELTLWLVYCGLVFLMGGCVTSRRAQEMAAAARDAGWLAGFQQGRASSDVVVRALDLHFSKCLSDLVDARAEEQTNRDLAVREKEFDIQEIRPMHDLWPPYRPFGSREKR